VVADNEEASLEPYWVRIRRLRLAAGLSQPALFRRAPEGLSYGMIRSLERPYASERGGNLSASRYPTTGTLERISEALGVDPSIFPEYRLAKARERLDERKVGVDAALENHDEWISGALLLAERKARDALPPTRDEREQRPRLAGHENGGEVG
jgi:transcriptional regulator with XRE-family HTH domain